MDNSIIGGIVPPLVTAFDKERAIVAFLIDKVDGFFPCGTYGSGPQMESHERKRVVEVVIGEANGRVPVIVHAGTAATRTTVELSKHAERAGAAAVACVPPFYYTFKESEVVRHFAEVVSAVSIPVLVYNNPKTTGVTVNADMLARLVDIGVAGVKDSSFDILLFHSYMRRIQQEGFIFIIGSESLILPAVILGAAGSVSGLANAMPEPVRGLFRAAVAGNLAEAVRLQTLVSAMRDVMHLAPTIPMIQALLRRRGVNAGYPRLPFVLPDRDLTNRAVQALRELGVSIG
jgi:dihydrodipicolinate synthase/N-acetylneuraminate lyase